MDGDVEGRPGPDAGVGASGLPADPPDGGRPDGPRWVPVCPFLSAIDPDDRLRTPLPAPDPSNRCLSSGVPAAVLGRDQATLCLDAAHAECPRYIRATMGPAVDAPVAADRRISLPILAAVGLLVTAAVVGGASVAIRGDLSAGVSATGPPASGAVAASTATSPGAASAGPGGSGAPDAGESPAPGATATPGSPSASAPPSSPVATSPSPVVAPATPVAYPGLTPCPGVPDCYVYVVKGGDNLTRVAVRYGLTLDEVLERNPTISDPSHIVRGQKIRLPTPRR